MNPTALTDEQKHQFAQDGIVKLPGIVPADLVNRARRAINANIGDKGIDPNLLTQYRAQSYCPGLGNESVITDLYNATPLRAVAETMIGPGKVRPVKGTQIALRFPTSDFDMVGRISGPHIDGMYSPTNGVPEGTIGNFTALVAVFLSDLPEPFAGNFAYWPGTHRTYAEYFREHGPESLMKGMPPVDLPQPVQFTGQAGDAAIVHYLLAHSIANNISPHIRYALFFRLMHTEHDAMKWESMTDPWLEWAGMREAAETT